jgi:glycosyltransferase involved in cell wall biosynthesis
LHIFWAVLSGMLALAWIFIVIDVARGVPMLPALSAVSPLRDDECPPVSILVAARDEAEKLPGALKTFLALDYPRYEVVAVDDRSKDATERILKSAAASDSRLKLVRIDTLPAGWLGKPHALEEAYKHANGEWLVFTDADVSFAPDLLRRAVALAMTRGWDHLTLLGRAEMYGFWETMAMTFFGMGFLMGTRPWRVSNPRSGAYVGAGSFQLIRRSAYEKMGTHRALAMEVIDDVKLGKVVKQAGFRSGVGRAGSAVSVHWHSGVRNIVLGTTKNFFAAAGFRLWVTCGGLLALFLMFVFPLVELPFVHGWTRIFAAVAVVMPMLVEMGVALEFGASPFFALTYPIGAVLFGWMQLRSAIVTLRQGGIVWRGTFYPLEELRRGMV